MTNGKKPSGDTLWRFVGGGDSGHLQNKRTGGHLNFRPGGFVRGHGNEERPPRKPASAGQSTRLDRFAVDFGHLSHGCVRSKDVFTFKFRGGPRGGSGFLHVLSDGSLSATKAQCSDDLACLFRMEDVPSRPGWHVVRSMLTGGLLRMVQDVHPAFDGWDGVRKPKASAKGRRQIQREMRLARSLELRSVSSKCPLRPSATRSAPKGWVYNSSSYAKVIRSSLAPWYDGGVTATVMDLGYFTSMYPFQNRHERPSLHLSLRSDGIRFKWQRSALRKGEKREPASGKGGTYPPTHSQDMAFLKMMSDVHRLIELPEVEFVAHTSRLPKVPAQNLELVFGPSTDPAHNDVPVPSPWLYASSKAANAPAAACSRPSQLQRLCVFATCSGPVDGYRGPLWRHYPPHRAALLALRDPSLKGRLSVSLPSPCMGPRLEDLPLEAAWERRAALELKSEAASDVWDGTLHTKSEKEPCLCQWELVLDTQGPDSERLLHAFKRGALVFKQYSPYREFFHVLMVEWVHYVPVADNLNDLSAKLAWADGHPEKVARIQAAGKLLATRLNAHEIACFWWQLLTSLAPLETFEPREDERRLGFVKYA